MAAAALLLALLLGGPARAEPTNSAARAAVQAGTAVDLSRFDTADALWNHLQAIQRGPSSPPQSHAEAVQMAHEFLRDGQASIAEFLRRYPGDSRRWDALFFKVQLMDWSASLSDQPPDLAQREALLKQISGAADATAAAKAEARLQLIETHADAPAASTAAGVAAIEAEIGAFQKDYPFDPRSPSLQFLRVMLYEKSNPDKAASILKELQGSAEPMVAREAQRRSNVMAVKKKPVDLAFTSTDGARVDLAKLRGKVVLLDFWATWCRPCLMDLPSVKAAYQKYHEKGLEIVGISLDEKKDQLQAVVKEQGMAWPQFFDGQSFEGSLIARFGVDRIPTKWLVDKKGYARAVDATVDLDPQIEKLLAE